MTVIAWPTGAGEGEHVLHPVPVLAELSGLVLLRWACHPFCFAFGWKFTFPSQPVAIDG